MIETGEGVEEALGGGAVADDHTTLRAPFVGVDSRDRACARGCLLHDPSEHTRHNFIISTILI